MATHSIWYIRSRVFVHHFRSGRISSFINKFWISSPCANISCFRSNFGQHLPEHQIIRSRRCFPHRSYRFDDNGERDGNGKRVAGPGMYTLSNDCAHRYLVNGNFPIVQIRPSATIEHRMNCFILSSFYIIISLLSGIFCPFIMCLRFLFHFTFQDSAIASAANLTSRMANLKLLYTIIDLWSSIPHNHSTSRFFSSSIYVWFAFNTKYRVKENREKRRSFFVPLLALFLVCFHS